MAIRVAEFSSGGYKISRDEFELEFSGSSEPELRSFRAELGHFNF